MFGVAVGATAAGLLDDNEHSDRSALQKAKDNLIQARNNVVTGADKSQASLNAHIDAITDGDLTDALQNQAILNELNAQLTQGTHADGSSVYLTQGTVNDQGQEVKGQANTTKGHTYLNINHIDTTVETLNHEIAHHNGLGETSATAMGKIGDFAYNIGTSLNQEDINTHRQTITPTEKTLQSLSTEDRLAYHAQNQAVLDENKEQLEGEMESGDEILNHAGTASIAGNKRQRKENCRLANVSAENCDQYNRYLVGQVFKEAALMVVPTSPQEAIVVVATGGAGGFAIKVGGKLLTKAGKVIRFESKAEAEKTAELSGMLRVAAHEKGNFTIGQATRAESDLMGKAWVGDGYKVASDGKTLVSADGLRTYRPPSSKSSPYATTGTQANFETLELVKHKGVWKKKVIRNGHLNILD